MTVEHASRLIGRYLLLGFIATIFVMPVIFMIVSSLKPDLQLLTDTSSVRALLPVGDISLNNYEAAFNRAPIWLFIFNSIFITSTTLVLSLFLTSVAAFAFVFIDWRGKHIVLSVIIATYILPFETVAVPLLLLVNNLPWLSNEGITWGWLNSYQVQIIPWIVRALEIFLFVQYFKDLPRDLVEAARVDGSSWFQIYRRVVMPLSGPVIATVAILKFLEMYNNQFIWPIMVVQEEGYRPIMLGLQYFFQLNTAWGEVMAYLTIITVPVLIFYLILQRAFIASIASTGVKG